MEEQEVIALQPACSSPGVAARGPGQGSGAAPQLPANHCLRARQKPAAAGYFPVSVVANLRQNIVLRFLNLRRKDVKVGEKEGATIFGSRPLEKKKRKKKGASCQPCKEHAEASPSSFTLQITEARPQPTTLPLSGCCQGLTGWHSGQQPVGEAARNLSWCQQQLVVPSALSLPAPCTQKPNAQKSPATHGRKLPRAAPMCHLRPAPRGTAAFPAGKCGVLSTGAYYTQACDR